MIGHLRGRLVRKAPPALIVDVHGVGYELEAPMSTFYRLPELGSEVELHTHLVVREDAHLLYGFATEAVRAVVAFGFDTLELHRIFAFTDVTNVASKRVLEKVGFEKEGVLRKHTRRSGVWCDSAVFGVLNQKHAGRVL